MVGLYNAENGLLKKAYRLFSAKIFNEIVKVLFGDLPIGTYAISFYHDENNNGEF